MIKVGKRTIAAGLGKGTRSSQGNLQHITEKLQELHDLGLIRLGEADRLGTSIAVISPDQVPWVVKARGRLCWRGRTPRTVSKGSPAVLSDPQGFEHEQRFTTSGPADRSVGE